MIEIGIRIRCEDCKGRGKKARYRCECRMGRDGLKVEHLQEHRCSCGRGPEGLSIEKWQCGKCHGPTAAADLDLTTYAGTIEGGVSGPVIVAGDSANSLLVIVQSGRHFAVFSAEELEKVIEWIDTGAPEKP